MKPSPKAGLSWSASNNISSKKPLSHCLGRTLAPLCLPACSLREDRIGRPCSSFLFFSASPKGNQACLSPPSAAAPGRQVSGPAVAFLRVSIWCAAVVLTVVPTLRGNKAVDSFPQSSAPEFSCLLSKWHALSLQIQRNEVLRFCSPLGLLSNAFFLLALFPPPPFFLFGSLVLSV